MIFLISFQVEHHPIVVSETIKSVKGTIKSSEQ